MAVLAMECPLAKGFAKRLMPEGGRGVRCIGNTYAAEPGRQPAFAICESGPLTRRSDASAHAKPASKSYGTPHAVRASSPPTFFACPGIAQYYTAYLSPCVNVDDILRPHCPRANTRRREPGSFSSGPGAHLLARASRLRGEAGRTALFELSTFQPFVLTLSSLLTIFGTPGLDTGDGGYRPRGLPSTRQVNCQFVLRSERPQCC